MRTLKWAVLTDELFSGLSFVRVCVLIFTRASLFLLWLVILCFVYFLFVIVWLPIYQCNLKLVSEMTCHALTNRQIDRHITRFSYYSSRRCTSRKDPESIELKKCVCARKIINIYRCQTALSSVQRYRIIDWASRPRSIHRLSAMLSCRTRHYTRWVDNNVSWQKIQTENVSKSLFQQLLSEEDICLAKNKFKKL